VRFARIIYTSFDLYPYCLVIGTLVLEQLRRIFVTRNTLYTLGYTEILVRQNETAATFILNMSRITPLLSTLLLTERYTSSMMRWIAPY